MSYKNSEGIILRSAPYRDFDTILTVFSKNEGKLKLLKRRGCHHNLSCLSHIEFTYFLGKSDLYTCNSLSVIHHRLALRKNLSTLETACELLKAIEKILVQNVENDFLFDRLTECLDLLPQFHHPKTSLAWFYLLILKEEGIYPEQQSAEIRILEEVKTSKQLLNFICTDQTLKKIRDLFHAQVH